jgi:alpha-tubulin suppressor-like RCC1 family protein
VLVVGGLRFVEISARAYHTCGRTIGGSAYCWGKNSGDLGDGTTVNSAVPVPVLGGLKFRELTTGEAHTCAITFGAKAYCWGSNNFGQLGDGSKVNDYFPIPVSW